MPEIRTKKRTILEHKKLNALVYVRYNTKLRERAIRRRQNYDPILVEEVDSDDEWITEKEESVLLKDTSWLDDENLFEVDAVRVLPVVANEGDDQETQAFACPHSLIPCKRKSNGSSEYSGTQDKGKRPKLALIEEADDVEVGEGEFLSGRITSIEEFDEDDDYDEEDFDSSF